MHLSEMNQPVPSAGSRNRASAILPALRSMKATGSSAISDLDRLTERFAYYLLSRGVPTRATSSRFACRVVLTGRWQLSAFGRLVLRPYVPLDTSWPDARLRFALEDSGAKAMVAGSPLLNRKNGIREIDILDDAWRFLHGEVASSSSG